MAAAAPRRRPPAAPDPATQSKVAARRRAPRALHPVTLAVDVGGTGVKASILDHLGALVTDPVRLTTPYPCPPDTLVTTICTIAGQLPRYDRVSVGFPGMVRGGRILSAPHFVTVAGPGTAISSELVEAWRDIDMAAVLAAALGRPTKVVNDADLQGAAVVAGTGLELVVTLGTGLGTALFHEGCLAPHLELAHHPFRNGQTYNEQVGDAARKHIGSKKWNRRVRLAVETLDRLLFFDHLYIGGGNARRIDGDLGPKVTLVDNVAGILGGIKLWERPTL